MYEKEEVEKVKCQACDKMFDPESEEALKLDNDVPERWMMPSSYCACSYDCQKVLVQANGIHRFISFIRNNQSMRYEKFVEVFRLPEEGGYAANKYERFLANPFTFVYALDTDALITLIKNNVV